MKSITTHNTVKNLYAIIIIISMGIYPLILGVNITFREISFCKTEKVTKGVIKNVDVIHSGKSDTSYITIDYFIDNYMYTNEIQINSLSYKEDMEVDVYYNPENHLDIRLASKTYINGFLIDAIGLIVITIGVASFLKSRKKEKRKKWLIEYGIKTMAEIKELKICKSFSNQSLIILVCTAGDNEKNQTVYESEKFYSKHFAYVGKQVPVYVNVLDNNEYYVDVQQIDIL
jgi:hypothetical protein